MCTARFCGSVGAYPPPDILLPGYPTPLPNQRDLVAETP